MDDAPGLMPLAEFVRTLPERLCTRELPNAVKLAALLTHEGYDLTRRCIMCGGPNERIRSPFCQSSCGNSFADTFWWDRIKNRVERRDNHTCQECDFKSPPGIIHTFEVHHIVPIKEGGHNGDSNLITLCHKCHRLWHRNKWRHHKSCRPPPTIPLTLPAKQRTIDVFYEM